MLDYAKNHTFIREVMFLGTRALGYFRQSESLLMPDQVIDLVLQNTPESMDILKRRHNMHRLSGNWTGRNECHVANSGDWLVIWSSNEEVAFFERTGSHDELFR